MTQRAWDRRLWGVEFRGSRRDRPLLIGAGWWGGTSAMVRYQGEPTRPLLFTSRTLARQWCEAERTKYALRAACRDWRFRPVRVREIVRKVSP